MFCSVKRVIAHPNAEPESRRSGGGRCHRLSKIEADSQLSRVVGRRQAGKSGLRAKEKWPWAAICLAIAAQQAQPLSALARTVGGDRGWKHI
jgi:hypothetical protein